MNAEDRRRVIIAVTEGASVDRLWHFSARWLTTPDIELVVLYLSDDRWQRVASLPFTREFPRTGGAASDFTKKRAQQVHEAAIRQIRDLIQQRAAEARLPLVFETLAHTDPDRLREFIDRRASVIIAPAMIAREPIFVHLSQLGCRIELVDDDRES